MTLDQVADYLRLKPQTIYSWAQGGKIPAAKIGREWRFRQSILDDWINTAIHLSEAGFDLMVNHSWLKLEESRATEEEIDEIVDRHWDPLCD
jgi:excisionase family DNA binding protein